MPCLLLSGSIPIVLMWDFTLTIWGVDTFSTQPSHTIIVVASVSNISGLNGFAIIVVLTVLYLVLASVFPSFYSYEDSSGRYCLHPSGKVCLDSIFKIFSILPTFATFCHKDRTCALIISSYLSGLSFFAFDILSLKSNWVLLLVMSNWLLMSPPMCLSFMSWCFVTDKVFIVSNIHLLQYGVNNLLLFNSQLNYPFSCFPDMRWDLGFLDVTVVFSFGSAWSWCVMHACIWNLPFLICSPVLVFAFFKL